MKKTLLLFLLLPFFAISQTDLVKWDDANSLASHVLVSATQVSSSDMSGANLSILNYVGFTGTNWPAGNVIDPATYIQISIKAETGYKIDLSSLKFAYNPYDGNQGCRKYQVRYSKDSSFPSNGTLLLDNQNPSISAKTNVDLPFPTGVYILPEETMYIRFYAYDRGNTGWAGARWGLLNSNTQVNDGSYFVPTINGSVSAYNPTLKAFDDTATSIKNNFTFVNVLANDSQATNPISSLTVATQPTNSGGTAVVNATDKTIKFTPTPGFTGATSFTYTIGDGTNTSTATVNVNVTAPTVDPLVRWNGPSDAIATVTAPAAISAGNITSTPASILTVLTNEGFKTAGWPTNFAKDENKYVELTVNAKTGYKVNLNSFDFTYNGAGNVDVKRYQVRYSKDGFNTSYLLLDEATTTGKVNKSLSLANLTLVAGETLSIRIYGYKVYVYGDLNSPIFLANSNTIQAGNTVPTITGTVLLYDPADINANDDNVTTRKNTAIKINTLNNDTTGASPISSITIASQPSLGQGTATVNPDKTITFTPGTDFTGDTSFKYTITNSTQSATGTVFVKVEDATPSLVIWNGASQQPVAAVSDPNITATNINANGMTFSSVDSNFRINSIPTALDYTKYIQVSVTPKAGYKLDLTQFKFTYKSPSDQDAGPKKYQVHYSTDPTFPANGNTLIAETTAVLNTQTTVSVNFPPGVVALPNQTVYIRIYVYENNQYYSDYYLVHDNGGELGPTIMGVVSSIDTLTAIYDNATTVRNQAVTIPVLANDLRGSIPLQPITISTQSLNGTATVNGENIIFNPSNGFTGLTSFVYTISNGSSTSSAIVYVTVTDPPCVAALTPGINYWNGYVYTYTGTPAPTTYVGTITEKANFERDVQYGTITGDATVAADNFCGPVPAENFLVRYLMQTTTTADTYNFTVGGDDGVRLYIDGNLVNLTPTDSWTDHGYITYVAQVPLTAGTHNFILEYYEKGGIARVSFSHGPVIAPNASLPFGINKWNVYGFNLPDINLQTASFAGTYVDPNLSFDTQAFWDKTKSPSYSSNWQGAPMPVDNFTITYKRRGFPCGRYQLVLANCDDVAKIFIDGVDIFTQNGYSNANVEVNGQTTYFLNENSTVEVRLREDGGDANIALNFIDTPTEYNGTGTISPNTTSIRIKENTTLNNDIQVCSCTIDKDIILTVASNKTLTVNETINVGAGGKLLLEDGASLLQNSTESNAYQGDAYSFQVQRNTELVRRYDFTYWSTPITRTPAYTLHELSPETLLDKYSSYDSSINAWDINLNGTKEMIPGVGYTVRAPQHFSITNGAIYLATFTGIPNNGDYSIPLYNTNWSLIGNPYPSAIDAEKFIDINHKASPSVDVGALYFWTHNTPPSDKPSAGGTYDYTSNDYAVFNLSGSIGTGGAKLPNGNFGPPPTGEIASCQSFFMRASGSGIVKFTNDMRISGNNDQFYKTAKPSTLEKNRVWLNLTNVKGAFKQALIGYIEGASNSWDINYDATTMNGNSFIDFYSINESKKLAIQGRALPFQDTDQVPLGYKTTVAGDFTIAIDHTDGVFNNQAVYLEDKTTGTVTNLQAGNYTFTTAIGTFIDRFTISYIKKTLGTDDFENLENSVLVSIKDKVVKVTATKETIKEVSIYDINGQLLYNKKKIGTAELQIPNLQSSNQVLLVKVTLDNDYLTTKKIIFN
ncbi:tandem-95 repeat protein [Flavobacterium sp. ov086]|uniref:Ig-like domain-containing protein n=1 Tax=Flavobacterium sp. ov086 TaxID=1761785 RepID=UPI000B67FAAD|nr:tandem-95 repeat protein [Flavobacterium sp. ov086]SNS01324.1 hypothetical protein SAMN04487979_1433 [Flavobacterium sp. ov086]